MATIYKRKGVENVLVLEPREALIMPFTVPATYSEIRLGAFLSLTNTASYSATNLTTDPGNISMAISNDNKNRVLMGIVNRTGVFPGLSSCVFLGYGTSDVYLGGTNSFYKGNDANRWCCEINTSDPTLPLLNKHGALGIINPTAQFSATTTSNYLHEITMQIPSSGDADTAYNTFYGIDYQFYNTGIASQSVAMRAAVDPNNYYRNYSKDSAWFSSHYSEEYLDRNTLGAKGFGNVSSTASALQTRTYALGYDFPNAAFFYLPYSNLRLRIHSVGVYVKKV